MALVTSRALVLRVHALGETSKVVVCYTRDHGKVRLVAKGGRKAGSRLGASLEPFVVSGVVFYLRQGRELSLVSQADIESNFPGLRRDVRRLAYASAVLELVDLLVVEREPDPALFDAVVQSLAEMESAPLGELEPALWRLELSLAGRLGYAPELERCVVCGRPADDRAVFSPDLGGLVCPACLVERAGLDAIGGRAVAVLRALARGSDVRAEGLPLSARERVGEGLIRFLGAHAGRPIVLKSLGFLSQVRRAEPSTGGPEGTDDDA
jgi:DNA repair protein RecO (recombination protein O)